MVFMVPSVQKYLVRVHEEAGEQYYSNLGGEGTAVHKIPVKYVGVVDGWKTILGKEALRY